MTPSPVASFMASLFRNWPRSARLLDPGAGIGSLTEAFATKFLEKATLESHLATTAYEIEPILVSYLGEHLRALEVQGENSRLVIESELVAQDFIREAAFASSFGARRYTHAILNPPYKKLSASSEYRTLLRAIGVEAGNLYTAFLGLAVSLTEEGGEIVAIVPRSFCNGMYFRPFRRWLLERVALSHIHVFESRKTTFRDDDVLQENIIIRLERGSTQGAVTISKSNGPSFDDYTERQVPFEEVVKPSDAERFIHIPTSETGGSKELFSHSLSDLDLDVATGPVVDFRLRAQCRAMPEPKTVPLLYAHHFSGGALQWPREHKKPNAIVVNDQTKKWLMPKGWYTITKRFSAKEERKRIVAYVVEFSYVAI